MKTKGHFNLHFNFEAVIYLEHFLMLLTNKVLVIRSTNDMQQWTPQFYLPTSSELLPHRDKASNGRESSDVTSLNPA